MTNDHDGTPMILGRYAGFVTRAAAFAIDRGIVLGIAFVIIFVVQYFLNLFMIDEWLSSLFKGQTIHTLFAILLSSAGVNLIVSIIYDISFWMLSGQTPGKRILGVRIIRADGQRLHLRNAILRQIGYWVSSIFFLGYLWILFDNKRQGFHDKMGGTIVTYSWPEGRMRGTFVIERVTRFRDRRLQN